MLIEGLIPAEGVVLFHGQPRSGKSPAALDCAIAVATGTSSVWPRPSQASTAVPVLYRLEEDPPSEIWKRLDGLIKGRGLSSLPNMLRLSIRKGFSLDCLPHQEQLIAEIRQRGYRVVVFDTLRRRDRPCRPRSG